jgi:hypothetical protein
MKTEFIPYEQALELKELGFDEPCFAFFNGKYHDWLIDDNNGLNSPTINPNKDIGRCVKRPTFSQAFRWFREKYNISYSIDWMSRSSEFYNGYYVHFRVINDNKINQENFIVLNDELPSKGYKVYKTYEEAELACLKKLIEIVNK